MVTFCRNLAIALGTLIGAVVITALAQGAFQYALPTVSGRIVGRTDVATYAALVVLGALYFLVGTCAPRWLRTQVPLLWMLFPVVAVYLLAIVGQPYAYRCNPLDTTYVVSCWLTLSPFIVSAATVVAGYMLHGRRSRVFRGAV
jgi:hypothetical protein